MLFCMVESAVVANWALSLLYIRNIRLDAHIGKCQRSASLPTKAIQTVGD
jgi:hypothetical protein